MRKIKAFIKIVDNLNEWTGKIVSMMILPMASILLYEVIMRYGFDRPTIWAHESAEFFYGTHFIIGGAYALRWKAHVNVEILYERFPLRVRALLDLLTWMLFYLFASMLLWQGGIAAWKAVARTEHSQTMWAPPIWPIKLTIPLAAALILLQGFSKTIRDLYAAINGRELIVTVTKVEKL